VETSDKKEEKMNEKKKKKLDGRTIGLSRIDEAAFATGNWFISVPILN
jgi:hypothetical protein